MSLQRDCKDTVNEPVKGFKSRKLVEEPVFFNSSHEHQNDTNLLPDLRKNRMIFNGFCTFSV